MKADEVRHQPWFEYAGAAAFVLLALTCQYVVDARTNDAHTGFEFSTLAVLAAARLFKLGPSLSAAALAVVGQVVLFLDPLWLHTTVSIGDVVEWALFAAIAALICLLVDRLKGARLTNERTVKELVASDRARELSEHRLDAGLTAIGDPILILLPVRAAGPSGLADAGPVEDFAIEYENHDAAMLHVGGAPARAQHVGQRLSLVGPVHARSGLVRLYAEAYGKVGDGPVEQELALPADDGGTRHVEVRAHRSGEGVVVQWRDVTARRRAEASRAISEGRYRTLVQSIGAIVWNTGADGRFGNAMPGWAAFTGQTPEQSVGLGWLAAIHPDDRARCDRAWRDALASGRSFEVERRVRRADGAYRHMITRAVPIRDGGRSVGPVHEWLGVDTDVTERKQADAIIADNERQLRRVLNALFSFVTVTTPDGTVIGANDAPLRAAGLSAADVIGKKLWDCAWWYGMPEIVDRVREWIGRAAAGEIVRQDIPMRLGADEQIIVDFMIAPMRDEQGTITHLIPSAVDVSDRHRAQAELAERERRFRRLYESNLIGIAFYDNDAAIAEANAAMRAILGLDDVDASDAAAAESSTIPWMPVSAPEWAEVDRLQRERLDREGRCGPFEKEYLRPDGSRVPVLVAAARIDGDRPGAGVAFAMDLTRIKRVEDALRRTEASLRAVNESLEQRIRERTAEVQQRSDQLRALALQMTEAESRERKRLAQLLHDHFQQLVSAAKLKVGLLRRRLGEDSPLHETIVQAEQLLAETIDASRSLATELSPPVLHDAGLEPALDWLARRVERDHNLLVDVRVDPGCEPDNEQVRTILFECAKELLFNVHKHSGADRATLSVTMPSPGLIQLSVADQGSGFDPFLVEVKPKPDGSFGLFSIKERLSLLGGIVRVRSHAGSGTQVLLTVPVATRADSANTGGPASPHDSVVGLAVDGVPTVRVLVADDHRLFREGLISLIGQESFVDVVGQANDGQEAVEMAHALKPDILICDITMPKLNGVQVTSQLHREMPELKIIGLSMHERDDMATAMRDAGAVAYCTKGGPTETLLGVLRGVAGSSMNPHATSPTNATAPEAPAV